MTFYQSVKLSGLNSEIQIQLKEKEEQKPLLLSTDAVYSDAVGFHKILLA